MRCDINMTDLKKHTSKQNGFTLMEVMVAVAVMGISLVGLMHVFSSLLSGIGRAELYAEGTMVAREVLERSLIGRHLEEGVYTGEVHNMFQWELVVTPRETALDLQEGLMALESSPGLLQINFTPLRQINDKNNGKKYHSYKSREKGCKDSYTVWKAG